MRPALLRDPFVRRLFLSATLTVAALGAAPLVSDLGIQPADDAGTLLGLTITLFGVIYLAILAASLAWALVSLRLSPPAGEPN